MHIEFIRKFGLNREGALSSAWSSAGQTFAMSAVFRPSLQPASGRRSSLQNRVFHLNCLTYIFYQTCAKVPKRSEILGSLSPRSGTLMDLGPCTSFLSWDSGNPGPQNCDMPQDPGNPGPQDFDMQRDPGNTGPQSFNSRKTLETQDLKIWICCKTLETQSPEPQNFDVSRL